MADEIERKFLTTGYHLAVVRDDEIFPHFSHRLWLKTIGAEVSSIAQLAQYYLSLKFDSDGKVVEEDRVRKKVLLDEEGRVDKIKFTRNSKIGFGLTREETPEVELDPAEFENLVQNSQFLSLNTGEPPQVHKLRTTAQIGSRTIEIDRYLGPALGGLCVTELEFLSEKEAINFTPTDLPRGILGQELNPTIFGNAQLALTAEIPAGITLPRYLRPS
ncbi:MAG: hypothetical protein QG623_441 [Patescibacteria group bacterium]|nr:hypothetical protein [Patescibacteria group bacterium]